LRRRAYRVRDKWGSMRQVPGASITLTPGHTHGEGRTMSISKVRGWLYFLAKLLGDLSAIQKGRIGQRLARRA